jgi:CheY-like chemotaxis protein
MTVTELFPTLRNLPRADKLKVMQFLVTELAQEEEPALQHGATYEIWSPFDSHEAAHKLAQLLEAEPPQA